VILGYPWLTGFEPVFHWQDETLDEAFQPIVISSLGLKHPPSPDISIRLAREDDCKHPHIPDIPVRRQSNDDHEYVAACSVAQTLIPACPIPLGRVAEEDWERVVEEDVCPHTFLRRTTTASELAQKAADKTVRTFEEMVPEEYHCYHRVFSEEESHRFPPPRIWDHAIDLLPNAPTSLDCKVYPMTAGETEAFTEWVQEELRKGFLR
jgi:hypothetical protein